MVKKIKGRKRQPWEARQDIDRAHRASLSADISEITGHHERVSRALGKKVFSFDLHGTLVLPRMPMEDYVLRQFQEVMKKHDINLLAEFYGIGHEFAKKLGVPLERIDRYLVRLLTEHYVATIIRDDSRKYKSALSTLAEEEGYAELKKNKQLRMSLVNAMVLSETLGYDQLPLGQTTSMAEEIHHRIDAFGDEWMLSPNTAKLLDHVASLKPRPVMCILSNTTFKAASKAVQQYLSKWFSPWMIFTPDILGGYLKPSPEAYIGAIVAARCGVVRNAIEGRDVDEKLVAIVLEAMGNDSFDAQQWEAARGAAIENAQRVIATDKRLGVESIYAGIDTFIEQMKLPRQLRSNLGMRYEQYHHVGNSQLHDRVPRMNATDGLLERFYNRLLGIAQ